ncbi:hypothetical protein CD798_14185 [Bacillaceae bacterium SAOS 7]|nr:hypothetical protein CD798_14185 [Bacillaceae bacterium SAOS 7]
MGLGNSLLFKNKIVILIVTFAFILLIWYLSANKTYKVEPDDVVQRQLSVENVERLDKFIEEAAEGKETHVRVIRMYERTYDHPNSPEGVIIYDLKSRYDNQAKVGWIEVTPNLSDFTPFEKSRVPTIENAQQCSRIIRDEELGYYMLNECHDAWSYELFPFKDRLFMEKERLEPQS